jgi:hypothetical protein
LQQYSKAIFSLPSFGWCSVSGFEAEGACEKAGFSQAAVAAGQAFDPLGFATGPIAVAYNVIPKIMNGTLSNQDAAGAVWDLATSFPFAGRILKYLPDLQYLIVPITDSSAGDVIQPQGPRK